MPKLTTPGKPAVSSVQSLELSRFKGVDLTSGEVNVSVHRSPDAPNIMPDDDGFPTKRTGWRTVRRFEKDEAIYGAHTYVHGGKESVIIHAGTKLYDGETLLYSNMAQGYSTGLQLGGKLWILDGETYLCYDGTKACPVQQIATVPIISIAKAPNGEHGATSYRPVNLLTGKRTDSFLGTDGDVNYFLSFNELNESAVSAEILGQNGVWNAASEGTEFTVERTLGKVVFKTTPGKSPVTGEDNVRITYEVQSNSANKINACRMGILYGLSGALDRIFVSGNPEEQNVDYWSEWNDPAYMGDIFYSVLGQEASPIVGYSVVNDQLVTHKRDEENGRNAFVRQGNLEADGTAAFPVCNVLQGEGAISTRSFASVNGEPLFLTSRGVYALTPGDVTGERYAQSRSFYINGGLLREQDLQSATAIAWGRFYVLAAGKKLYLLDAEQKSYEDKSPYSTFQYEGYYWTEIGAISLWEAGGQLFFGTKDGRVCCFEKPGYLHVYNDDDAAIACHWTTPLMNLGTWNRYKSVKGVWVVGQPYARSGGVISYATDKEYERKMREYAVDIFSWDDIDFSRWTFNTLDRPVITPTGKKAKKVKLFQVKVENSRLGEAFGLFAIQIDYITGGRV